MAAQAALRVLDHLIPRFLQLVVEVVEAVHQFSTIRLLHFRGHSLIRLAARVQLPHLALRQQRLYPQLGGQGVVPVVLDQLVEMEGLVQAAP